MQETCIDTVRFSDQGIEWNVTKVGFEPLYQVTSLLCLTVHNMYV